MAQGNPTGRFTVARTISPEGVRLALFHIKGHWTLRAIAHFEGHPIAVANCTLNVGFMYKILFAICCCDKTESFDMIKKLYRSSFHR